MADEATEAVIHKVLRRLIPFCILCYLLNYMDRSNAAIARDHMIREVPGFTAAAYDWGISWVFFIPYCLLEVPSNLAMQKVGPRRWIARIMITWGLVSMAFMFTRGTWSFLTLRALLGAAEAGFFPGILLYLSYWVPRAYRARAAAYFLLSQAIAQVIGNVLGGYILYLAEKHHFPGQPWQWVFIVEGVPTVIVGIAVLFCLTDYPAEAKWLTEEERGRLTGIMQDERKHLLASDASEFLHALRSPHTWGLSLLYGLAGCAYFPVNFFTPTILRNALIESKVIVLPASTTLPAELAATMPTPTPSHLASLYVGLLSAIPFGAAALTMLLFARHSDRRNERRFHMAFACGILLLGLLTVGAAPYLVDGKALTMLKIIGLSLAAIGYFGAAAVFWAVPAQLLTGTAIAAALAIINSIGNLVGTSLGPTRALFGWNEQQFMFIAAGSAVLAVMAALLLLRLPSDGAPPALGFAVEPAVKADQPVA
jgi:ACS family tartrate transporter-like MFS transporter